MKACGNLHVNVSNSGIFKTYEVSVNVGIVGTFHGAVSVVLWDCPWFNSTLDLSDELFSEASLCHNIMSICWL